MTDAPNGADATAAGAAAPGSIEDVLPPPAIADQAPNVQAAVASLVEEPKPAAAPAPGAPPAPGPHDHFVRAGTIRPEPAHSGPVSDAARERWSQRRLERSNRKELTRHIRDLEARVAAAEPLGVDGAGVPGAPLVNPITELEELFGIVLPAVSALLEYAVGPEMKVDATEQRVLVKTGAPAALPYYGRARAAAPLTPFLLTLAAVFGPKVIAAVDAKKKKTRDQVPTPAEREPAPAPRLVVEPTAARDRFGGPAT